MSCVTGHTKADEEHKWCLIIVVVIVCASPSLHADRCGSFVEPKAEYVVDFLLLLSVTRLTKFTSSFCCLLLCWLGLWPSLGRVGSAVFFTGMKEIVVNAFCSSWE